MTSLLSYVHLYYIGVDGRSRLLQLQRPAVVHLTRLNNPTSRWRVWRPAATVDMKLFPFTSSTCAPRVGPPDTLTTSKPCRVGTTECDGWRAVFVPNGIDGLAKSGGWGACCAWAASWFILKTPIDGKREEYTQPPSMLIMINMYANTDVCTRTCFTIIREEHSCPKQLP
jgi:hypothetical protein